MRSILELNHFKDYSGFKFSGAGAKRISRILAAAALLFFAAELITAVTSQVLPFRPVPAQPVSVPVISKTALEPLETFEKKISARNLFFSSVKEAPAVTVAGIEEKVKNLSLIGIIATGEPEAILKDSALNQTYFLKRHQKLRDLEVTEVKAGSVILKLDKEKKEIFLA